MVTPIKHIICLCCFWLLSQALFAQQKVEIGQANNHGNIITADTSVLRKAIQRTLSDGTQIDSMYILSSGAFHYLVARGTQRNLNKTVALQLRYDIMKRVYYAQEGDGYVTCTNAACDSCTLFREKGSIVGCHCAQKYTISNQCNFTRKEQSVFCINVIRAKTSVRKQ